MDAEDYEIYMADVKDKELENKLIVLESEMTRGNNMCSGAGCNADC